MLLLKSLAAVVLLAVAAPPEVVPSASQVREGAGRRLLAQTIVASTSVEWSSAFAARELGYRDPKVVFIEPPRHHPARGFGYSRHGLVVVDLGEMADVQRLLGADGDAIVALMIAHEVAHHVQRLIDVRRGSVLSQGVKRELEADCAAGWWLGRASARNALTRQGPVFQVPDLARQLPRLLQSLDILRTGRLPTSEADYSAGHGLGSERIAAIRRGLASADVSVCGAGISLS